MVLPAHRGAMLMTVEEFLLQRLPEGKAELVRGEIRVSPLAGAPHGVAATNLLMLLMIHVRQHALGRAFGGSFGYEFARLARTVRVPDVSFVRADRLPAAGVGPGLLKLAPDLVVEVLSPNESWADLEGKLHDYTIAGTPLIWVVDPVRRTVMIVAADSPVRWLGEDDRLDGGGVVAGFACAVADLFEGIARASSPE